jgi:hypothetical protein
MSTFSVNSQQGQQLVFEIPVGSKATVTFSGGWSFDPKRPPCGASGIGGPAGSGNPPFPYGDAPIGALCWRIDPLPGVPRGPQDTHGWCTSDNQTIVFGGTTPGDGAYWMQINDNSLVDNIGSIQVTYDIEKKA